MTHYEFRVEGRLTEEARTAIGDLRVTEVPPETVIDGEVVDESQLHGIIVQLQVLGIAVVSVHPVPESRRSQRRRDRRRAPGS